MTVDEAVAADRQYFDEHPDEEEYIREFVPGEFGAAELPEVPPGFRYATIVTVMLRVKGQDGFCPIGPAAKRFLSVLGHGETRVRPVFGPE
jgi:hypothetical protein